MCARAPRSHRSRPRPRSGTRRRGHRSTDRRPRSQRKIEASSSARARSNSPRCIATTPVAASHHARKKPLPRPVADHAQLVDDALDAGSSRSRNMKPIESILSPSATTQSSPSARPSAMLRSSTSARVLALGPQRLAVSDGVEGAGFGPLVVGTTTAMSNASRRKPPRRLLLVVVDGDVGGAPQCPRALHRRFARAGERRGRTTGNLRPCGRAAPRTRPARSRAAASSSRRRPVPPSRARPGSCRARPRTA